MNDESPGAYIVKADFVHYFHNKEACARLIAAWYGIDYDEMVRAAKKLADEIAQIADIVQNIMERLAEIFGEIQEEAERVEPRARRRRNERSRARMIEQQYRVKIKACERERPFRRIYKPPQKQINGGNRRNETRKGHFDSEILPGH